MNYIERLAPWYFGPRLKKMDSQELEIKNTAWIVGALCTSAIFYDFTYMQMNVSIRYVVLKFVTITLPLFFAYLDTEWIKPIRHACVYSSYVFYSFMGMVFVHPSYYFAYFQFFFALPFFYPYGGKGYKFVFLFGLITFYSGLYFAAELPYVKEGMSAKPDLMIAMFMVFGASWGLTNIVAKARFKSSLIRDQLATLGKTSGYVFHEMKSPLSRIRKLGKEYNVPVEYVREIEKLGAVLTSVEILALRRDVDLEKSVTPINSILSEVTFLYSGQIEATGFEIKKINIDGETILGESIMTELLFKNLIKNALEATFELSPEQRWVEISKSEGSLYFSNPLDSKARFDRTKCFEPGYTTKSNVSNHGLGLVLCQEICQLHGWKIDLVDVPGQFVVKVKL